MSDVVRHLEHWLDREQLAAHLGCSVRWVRYRQAEGMPHALIAGSRQVQGIGRRALARAARAHRAARGRGGMTKKKTYVGRVYLGRDENGRQQFDWLGRYELKRDRDEAVARRRVELKDRKGFQFPTCDEYTDRYLAEYERAHKHSSHDTATAALKRFRKDFAGHSLDVSRQLAKDTMYNHAIDDDDLPLAKNPFRKLGHAPRAAPTTPPPTEQEFQPSGRVRGVHKEYAPRMRAFLLFAAFTLMRPSELFALEWADIDFDGMRIDKARRLYRGKLAEPKTGPKTIALTPPARDACWASPATARSCSRARPASGSRARTCSGTGRS
jgi:integrase